MNVRRAAVAASLAGALMVLAALPARGAAQDPREVEGRALFAKGEYQRALDVFATLFAENADPVYLRNIGRCQQKLRHPDAAIDAFHEYLRRGRLQPAEREEIAGFIREMEALKAEARPAPPPPPPPLRVEKAAETEHGADPGAQAGGKPKPDPVRADGAPPLKLAATEPGPDAAHADLAGGPAPPKPGDAAEPGKPITGRWWFWAALGAVVVGGVVTAVALGSRGDAPTCPAGFSCP